MKKRLLALLLCLVMVIGLVPTAFAAHTFTIMLNHYEPETVTSQRPITKDNYVATTDKIIAKNCLPEATSAVMTHEGWVFDGWYYDFELTKKVGSDDVLNKDLTSDTIDLWAKWREVENNPPVDPVLYTITYKANDGTSTSRTQEIKASDTFKYNGETYVTLARNTFTWAGHTFLGWGLNATAVKSYSDMCSVKASDLFGSSTVVTLYAVWDGDAPVSTVKVTYQNNIAAEKYVDTVELGMYELENIPATWTIPTGKQFVGWTSDNVNVLPVGTRVFVSADVTYYPVYETIATEYTVTFYCWYHDKKNETQPFARDTRIIIDPNGGTYNGSKAKTEITVTSNVTVKDASRYGYSFDGWYVTKDSAGVYTFTAVWDNNYYYNTYSIYYYDYDDCKSEYANFPYGTSIVIDPNGGTAKLSGTSFSTKQSFNIYRDYTLTDASRSGYTFYGWELTKSGSTYYFTAMWSRYKSDVPYMLNGTDHYAYIKGYPNGSFKPTDTITRAEAATIFYRLLTDSTRKAYATTYNSFKDVPATAWYNTAVSTMAKLGIVNGGADGYFRPNDPITRAEIAAMIARCDGAYYTGTSTVFSDTYGHWAAGYIDRAYELGWINGYGTTYAPDRYISRAETVAVLNRVLNRAPQYTSDLTRNYTTFSDVATSAWYYLDVEEAANSHTYTRKSNADYETWTKLIADPSWF